MIADVLTKATPVNDVYRRFRDQGLYSLVPTTQQVEDEHHRLTLLQGQRQRAKLRRRSERDS